MQQQKVNIVEGKNLSFSYSCFQQSFDPLLTVIIFVVLNRLREQLLARGSTTIRGLGRTFRQLDSYDGNRKVDAGEFFVGMQENGVRITKAEADALLSYFDTDSDGHINFDEFLVGIRGKMNAKRQAMADKAFLKFDKDGNGCIEAADLKGVYNTSFHPKVISGEMTEDQVFLEFLANFGDKNKDGKIQREEWNDYYSAVSASIDNDDHFVQLMKTAWKLD
ncbi:ef hand family protein [Stylonychia lemnae]|uniref:Ef hand family protein n=1 Tax=Stylonychia lemnae TaxID=5949 RepID=A0A078A1L8_STYLE|nr:ef hand family protein [Stylonychia lemnae]|eukprot:CDW76005.1 ef hand family protein [Stylonychia lemnae]